MPCIADVAAQLLLQSLTRLAHPAAAAAAVNGSLLQLLLHCCCVPLGLLVLLGLEAQVLEAPIDCSTNRLRENDCGHCA
jgi:hypothetical protein